MEWLCVSIDTNPDNIDILTDKLHAIGVAGLEIETEEDFFNFLEQNKKYWDYVDEELINSKKGKACVKVYLQKNNDGQSTLEQIKECCNDASLYSISCITMKEEDWANNWKQYYKPVQIGENLLVCPIWEEYADKSKTVVKLDPGMTFGTGLHHSTQLALCSIEKYIKKDDLMLDLGCGSGILAIAGLLLGAQYAYCLDIDENAAKVCLENAALNDIYPPKIESDKGDILGDTLLKERVAQRKYDIISANIVADVIIPLCDIVPLFAKENTVFVTSGIIDTRKQDVIDKMEKCGFSVIEIAEKGGWCSITCGSLINK
ncbi:MAG: 50S ribosomal protein L11 methyltransferase [Ruminococcaceae bacterium]|nr:50S ribosomal protein L11 methyltransferase [Oscillospiraceae bacterium]